CAMPLGLGISGLNEVLGLEFYEPVEPADVQRRLVEQMPSGLEILTVRRLSVRSSAQVRRAGYRCPVPIALTTDLTRSSENLLAVEECWIERTRPAPRRL